MRRESIKTHLRPYSIYGRRVTTINHAFASAIAINDDYDDAQIRQAIIDLGQDPEQDLYCAYCDDKPAETWDHVTGLVQNAQYSGFGHTVGNLLPCCKDCNSRKGNRDWKVYLRVITQNDERYAHKIAQLERYFSKYQKPCFDQAAIAALMPDEMHTYNDIHQQVLELMKRADALAQKIRERTKVHLSHE
jgi:hypothetical protein